MGDGGVTAAHGAAPALGEAEARRLLDLALDAIFVRDASGVVRYWNAGAERLYGWPAAEALGEKVASLLATRYPDDEAQVVGQAAAQGSWEGELVQTARDGRTVLVQSRWVADVGAGGELLGFLEVNRDITERRIAEQRFRRLLEAAPDAVVIVDRDGRIEFANERIRDLFGYEPAELEGQPVEVLVPERSRATHPDRRRAYAADPRPLTIGSGLDLTGRRKDGTEFPAEISLGPLGTDEGMTISAAVRDVTHRKEAERRLNEQAAKLARSNADLERFAYIASHDLQEPLRKIATFCRLLKEDYGGKLDEMADTYIDYAVDGAVRMRDLINDLLEFSRIGRDDLAVEEVDTAAALDAALRNLESLREESRAEVVVGALPTVTAERSFVVQLFQNLVGNALKFRSAERPCRVEVGAAREDDHWVFRVADNGIGIAEDRREKVFELFSRLHARTEYPGTGIGLAICRRIVDRMGGRIWLESTPGEGSTFYWNLPA